MFRLVACQPLVPFDILSCSEVCILLCEFRTYLTSTLVYTPLSEFIWTRENNQTYIQDDDCTWGFPGHASGKESACQFRRYRFDPWVTKIPWRRAGQLAPVSLAGESHGQRSLASTGLQSWTRLKLLSKPVLFTHVWEMVQVAGGILQDFEKPMDLRFKENWSFFSGRFTPEQKYILGLKIGHPRY